MGETTGRERHTMFKRKVRSQEDIEFEWLTKARVQAIDERMNVLVNQAFFSYRIKGPNKKEAEASLLDSKNLTKKFDVILKEIDRRLKEYK